MDLLAIVLISLIQGLTEFLPVSSSAHLILLPRVSDIPDQGPLVDISVHVGTLAAVCVYIRHEIRRLFVGFFRMMVTRTLNPDAHLAICIIIGTLPIVFVGYFVHKLGWLQELREPIIIGWATLVFAFLLYLSDRVRASVTHLVNTSYKAAFAIGVAQILAIIPGTSRSGITMTAARFLGFNRVDAARFSLLLSVPTILGAGVLAARDILLTNGKAGIEMHLVSVVITFIISLMAITLLLRFLTNGSFRPFVIYRFLLGTFILGWYYL